METILFVFVVCLFSIIVLVVAIWREVAAMKRRLKDVANACMIAEIDTGIPYYTSLKTKPRVEEIPYLMGGDA